MFRNLNSRTSTILFTAALAIASATADAQAQQPFADNSPTLRQDMQGGSYSFLGGVVVGPYDVQNPPVPANGFVYGVEAAFGSFWVTGGDGSTVLNTGLIYKYDHNGALLAQFPQTSIASSTFGHRDGEADEFANKMWFGEETNRIVEYDYNPGNGGLTFARVYTLTNPLPGLLPATIRCLARNPQNGHFFTANFGTIVWEFVLDPNLVTATTVKTYVNPTLPATAFAGMAWDRTDNTLWGWAQNGTPALQAIEFTVGVSALTPTGRAFQGQNNPVGSTAGGMDLYPDSRNPGFLSMVAVHQAVPDSITVYDTAVPFTPPPYHDDCANAALFPCGSPPAVVSTLGATQDLLPGCTAPSVSPGVWFKFNGTGYPVTLSTCDALTNFDTRISVFTGTCGALTCLADNDDGACGVNPLASIVSFNTQFGVEYRALVHGGKLASDMGTFRLTETCPDYCQAGTSSACGPTLEIITRVRYGAIDNSTPTCVVGGYQNFMNLINPASIGCPQGIIVDTANPFSTDKVSVFIDWNQDFDFTDPGESVALVGAPVALPTQFTGNFTPPVGALLGNTRMRVALDDSLVVSPCGFSTFAYYEDYTVAVQPMVDTDGDLTPDCLDGCPTDPAKIAPGICGCGVADTDTDGDGTPNCNDLCPLDPLKIAPGFCGCNRPEVDTDGDGTPNCVDGCPLDPLKTAIGICGCGTPDTDTDNDGTPDCNDTCPNDPLKVDPGTCGCGVPDTDTDADGTPDCNDGCPTDPAKISPGFCGCGNPETDFDNDGTPNCVDNCIAIFNPDQLDSDNDGRGDLCDNCPFHANPNQVDCDGDGAGDVCEIANGTELDCQPNGIPDNCDPDCNTNLTPDDCDIFLGTSQDLNQNGLPDECEGPGIQYCFGDGAGTQCPCLNHSNGTGKGCLNSTNRGAILYNSGLASVSNDSSRLTAIQMPGNKAVIFFIGANQLNGGNGVHLADGLLCLQPTKRYPPQMSSPTGQIDIVQVVGLSGNLITAGSTWYFQAWYRDPTGPCALGSNLTNGLGITFTP
ncbi:MAG TPA: GEVED domain-containing protein [Planctomycetota bacterium]|nr:GEVED domain-containing protein [Planctomycetota bacterium]